MKLWTEIILEWLNCLDVLETTVNDLKELDDGKFYQKLISLFSWKGAKDTSDAKSIITEFLQDEYPEFKFDYNDLGDMERIYIASLFLLHVSQEPPFYQPMCIKLQHETQLKIKAFLEMIIPYNKSINREILKEIISELAGNIPKTPITPKTRALKDFFTSPAARTAQVHKLLNERNQELRKLRSELEVERFEKSDLHEDLRIQQNKVQNLQKKLEEKSAELKLLQEEKFKLNTPQSCKKNRNTVDYDRYYRKEIDHLEDQLMQKQCEIDKLEVANDTLTKKLTCMEKQCIYFKGKLENCEKYLETTQIIGELKDRELINLKMTNEELRVHLKELNKTTMAEQSFEIDGVAPLLSPLPSLNNSEILSSVVEIQLQEAKEESASLKTQLDTLNKKLECMSQDYDNTAELLKKRSQMLQDIETKSNITVNKLEKEIESLQKENESLIEENQNLQNVCAFQKENLLQAEKCKDTLNTEVTNLREKIKILEESLDTKNVYNAKLNTELVESKLQIHENLKHIQDLTDQTNLYKTSAELYNTNLKEIIVHIPEIDRDEVNDLDTKTTIQLIEYLQKSLYNLTEKYTSKQMELRSLNNLIEETELKVNNFQSQIFELEEIDKQKISEISKLKETTDQNIKEISKLTSIIEQYSEELIHLKEIQVQKQNLEKDLCTCKEELNKKVLLLTSFEKCIQTLKTDFQNLVTEFDTIKKYASNKLINCQKQHKETCNNILNAYETLYHNYIKEQLHRNKLEHELTDNKKELKDSKNLNITLENDSIKNKQIISDLELELINTKDKLTEAVQKIEKLGKIKETFEEQQKNLESENEKILMNLNKTNSELKSSQEEVHTISDQLKCKIEEIRNLITEISSLKLEKEHMLHSQKKRESEVKNLIQKLETELLQKERSLDRSNIEIKSNQETLEHVQNKLEKLTNETTVSEMKMKEVISNLQEVRANQDAVLVAQEKALKEKCLIIEQLQKEFGESKNSLCKHLENEKLLSQNLQSTNSKLQIQSYKQTKIIEELQETLKRERNELTKSKEYCQIQDARKFETVQVCELLRHSVNELKSVIIEKSPKNENLYGDGMCNEPCADNDDDVENILNIIRTSINEVQASHKLILHLSNMNTNLNETLQNQKEIINSYITKHEEYIKHLNNITENKSALKNSLENVVKLREDLDTCLNELKQKWDKLLTKYHSIFVMDKSICDELKYIQNKKADFESMLFKQYIYHYQNVKPLHNILWQKFMWSEQQLKDSYLNPIKSEKMLDIFSDEKAIIEAELQKNVLLQKDIVQFHNEVDDFSNFVTSFEINFESNETKFQSEAKKLQLQIDQLTEDKHNLELKLECAQLNNAKLENETKELKIRIKELKTSSEEIDDLKNELTQSKKENLMLQEERNKLINRPKQEDVDNQLKDIHDKYKLKLDEIKQNMKTAYNEQIAKLNKEQEQCVQERLESLQKKMELQCRKQADELSKYKAHVASMSTQIWDIGEKLLSEQQEKEKLQKELSLLKVKYQDLNEKIVSSIEYKSSKYERKDLLGENKEEMLHKVAVIQEKTTYERKCCIRSIQTMGNAFNAEDEDEVFDNIYLADMKDGNSSSNTEIDRLSILKKRNALCKPHLKSSYPAEMQFHPLPFSEEEIKSGSVPEDTFNDSLSQSLLPEQKLKKKDRTQISYKKPGPPTPSKNGGRLSLQGNELKSPNSRILKERNKDRATTTPRTLKGLFSSKRPDENTVITPRGRRRSSIFRKYRGTNDR